MEEIRKIMWNESAKAGLILGIFFVAKYIFYMFMIDYIYFSLIYFLATLFVPVIVYILTKKFRKKYFANREFSIGIAWIYGMRMYIFASIISMLAHAYYYIKIFPTVVPKVMDMFEDFSNQLGVSSKMYSNTVKESLAIMQEASLARKIFSDFSSNMLYAAVISFIVAAILKRK